jgi:hypothetical protein
MPTAPSTTNNIDIIVVKTGLDEGRRGSWRFPQRLASDLGAEVVR